MRFFFSCITLLWITTVTSSTALAAEASPPWQWILQGVRPGVCLDATQQAWDFYGVPIDHVRYEIPGAGIDLVRILFIGRDGIPYKVWAAVGIDMGRDYLSLGPWDTREQAQTIRLHETLLRIYISETDGTLHPEVDETGIRWTDCTPGTVCEYARVFDTMHNDLSNLFIEYEIAPGWYPWGFLFWDVEIISQYKRNATINLSMESRVR